jgi:uncharacterized protein
MLKVNLRQLENDEMQLTGELPVQALELELHDEMLRAEAPLEYDLTVQKLDDAVLVTGSLRLWLQCECVRCLKAFEFELDLPDWTLHLPLEGEDAVSLKNDSLDLTPFVREDILLEFPQHPLCKPDCGGIKKKRAVQPVKSGGKNETKPSAWAELNKLKL